MKEKPRVIVCQHGARHRYTIPRMLEQAGMLEALYTDSCEYSLLGKIAKMMGPMAKGPIKRLAGRKVNGVPSEKVFTTDRPICRYYFLKSKSYIDDYLLVHESMNDILIKYDFDKADILYCFEGENLGFIRYTKEKEMKIILDVCINPLTGKIVKEERLLYDKIYNHDEINKFINFREQYFISQANIADIMLCPSEFVASGVRHLCPDHEHKIRICSYGSSIDYGSRVNKPIKGRYFWAGGDWIRKGLHYLAEAANELKKKYPEMEFRVAGITDPEVIKKERFRHIKFLGKLDTHQMMEEFLSADAFVFPTLSEGMAGTVIEAIAAGCPVITTHAAGIDGIKNRKSGIIIPSKDYPAIIKGIELVYCDREFRDTVAENSKILAEYFTIDAWKKRLINIIHRM